MHRWAKGDGENGQDLGDNISRLHGPFIALAVTNVLYKKQAQIQEEELDNYGDYDLLWLMNEENAEIKSEDYHEDELGLEYEVDNRAREDHMKSDLDQRSRSDKWSRLL